MNLDRGETRGLLQGSAAASRLCTAFSHASALGFAIFDDNLRYREINAALAAINGIPAADHVGSTIVSLFGSEIAAQIEPRVKQLLVTGDPVHFEFNATLPTRTEPGSFIDHYFGIKGTSGKLIGVGLVVVEVTEQRKLELFINQLASELLGRQSTDAWHRARELHDAVDEYHFALSARIGDLTRKPEKSPEILAQAVDALDHRVLAMGALVAAVASRFPVGGDGNRR